MTPAHGVETSGYFNVGPRLNSADRTFTTLYNRIVIINIFLLRSHNLYEAGQCYFEQFCHHKNINKLEDDKLLNNAEILSSLLHTRFNRKSVWS